MLRWLVALTLTVASATGWAQPAPSGSTGSFERTTAAWNLADSAGKRVASLTAQKTSLAQRWQAELDSVKRMKNSPRTWRRDREISDAMSSANELAKQLEGVTSELARAHQQHAAAQSVLVAAIDAELATNPSQARRDRLEAARATVAPAHRARRIVLPDTQIDPLSDPSELDQQALAIREAELELERQIKGLEVQEKELERVAMLRRQHERTQELDQRENNDSSHGRNPSGRGGALDAEAGPMTMFETDATIALAEVVDQPTIDSLNKAGRSGDPKLRLEATRKTREAVVRKYDSMRGKRKAVEERARQLRGR